MAYQYIFIRVLKFNIEFKHDFVLDPLTKVLKATTIVNGINLETF